MFVIAKKQLINGHIVVAQNKWDEYWPPACKAGDGPAEGRAVRTADAAGCLLIRAAEGPRLRTDTKNVTAVHFTGGPEQAGFM